MNKINQASGFNKSLNPSELVAFSYIPRAQDNLLKLSQLGLKSSDTRDLLLQIDLCTTTNAVRTLSISRNETT